MNSNPNYFLLLIEEYSLDLILITGAMLCGAKSLPAFLGWTFLILSVAALAFRDSTLSINSSLTLFLSLIATSQFLSADFGASFVQTTQLLVFINLWVILQRYFAIHKKPQEHLWWTFDGLAVVTICMTLYQYTRHTMPYGFLPININFNAIWMAFLVCLFTAHQCLQNQTSLQLWLERLLLIFLISLILISSSRSAFIALFIGVTYTLWHLFPKYKVLLIAIICIGIGIGLYSNVLISRFHLSSDKNSQAVHMYRLSFWEIAIQGMIEHPFFGNGLGTYEWIYLKHAIPVEEDAVRYSRVTQFAHNEYLQLGCELGIPSLGMILLALFLILRHSPIRTNVWSVAGKTGLLTLSAAAFVNPIWHVPFLVFITLLCATMLYPHPLTSSSEYSKFRHTNTFLIICGTLCSLWLTARCFWVNQQNWNRILNVFPIDADAWSHLAYQQTNPALRLKAQQQAVHYSPTNPYYREDLAQAIVGAGDQSLLLIALKEYETAVRMAPSRANDILAVGRLYFIEGDIDQALEWFIRSRQLEPHYWESYLWIARCLYRQHHPNQACSLLEHLIISHDQFWDQHRGLLPKSGYERIILGYDLRVVKNDLARMRS